MTDDYEKYEIECERIRKQNVKLLDEFALWLQKSNLKDETIKKHANILISISTNISCMRMQQKQKKECLAQVCF